ncbi:unnamed protein product [Oikopleura dioica]|uniref:Uncharacterized protein n=1 Tax=Oikopleura dioica TaxID=34765 RepID=E4XCK8_OIKDI|nr:unnamed protein product [Oikopleura dioica]
MIRNFAPLKPTAGSSRQTLSLAASDIQYPISKAQHEIIQAELMKDTEYEFFANEIKEDAKRLLDNVAEIKRNLEKITKIQAKRSAIEDIQMALARGEVLHYEDQAIWDEGEDRISAELSEKKEFDRKLRKEKLEIRSMLERNKTDLQRYCLQTLQKTYSFEQAGRYYKIGRGKSATQKIVGIKIKLAAVDLVQPMGESLREVGRDFRDLITDQTRLRKLDYAEALKIVVRYEKAVEPHHKDLPSIQEALKIMRDNPKLSRFEWCQAVRALCDETLQIDFVKTVDQITATEEGNMDMSNSLNADTEFIQLMQQQRSLPQQRAKLAKEFNQARSYFSKEEHEKFGALVPAAPKNSFQHGQKQNRPNNKRGGKKHHNSNQQKHFQKTKDAGPPPKKSFKKNKEGFRPVSDQK